jgi:hypothetical protein
MSEKYVTTNTNTTDYKFTIAQPQTMVAPQNTFAPSYGHGHQVNPNYPPNYYTEPQSPDPWGGVQIEGLDELCEMLGVPEGGQGPLLTSVSGVRYSLVNVLRAQMELMVRLNVLLVHRRLVPDE